MGAAPVRLEPRIELERVDSKLQTNKIKPKKRNYRSSSTYVPSKIALNVIKKSTDDDKMKELVATNCSLTNEMLKSNAEIKLSGTKYMQLLEKSYADIFAWNEKVIQSEEKYVKLLQESFERQRKIFDLERAAKSKDEAIQILQSKVQDLEYNSVENLLQHGKINLIIISYCFKLNRIRICYRWK
jgi:hypothetical protein